MDTHDGLPLLYMSLSDLNDGMKSNSFVDDPATETKWFTYSSKQFNKDNFKFSSDDDMRIVTAPIMIADMPIYREHAELGGYYVAFNKKTIIDMRNLYAEEGRFNKINENHNGEAVIDGVYFVDSMIVGDKFSCSLYPDMNDGSWIASYWVKDEKYWNDKVKNGTFTGFSLEGAFTLTRDQIFTAQIKTIYESDKYSNEYKYNEIQRIYDLWTK